MKTSTDASYRPHGGQNTSAQLVHPQSVIGEPPTQNPDLDASTSWNPTSSQSVIRINHWEPSQHSSSACLRSTSRGHSAGRGEPPTSGYSLLPWFAGCCPGTSRGGHVVYLEREQQCSYYVCGCAGCWREHQIMISRESPSPNSISRHISWNREAEREVGGLNIYADASCVNI